MTITLVAIDPRGDRAVFRQLADLLRMAIERGDYAPGRMLPSESQLIGEHGVARITVRQAIAELRSEGLIVTVPRVGSYVRGPTEDVTTVRIHTATRVTARMPTHGERRDLAIAEGVPVFVVEREGGEAAIYPADRVVLEFRVDGRTPSEVTAKGGSDGT